jgi:hypothetical protein
MQKYYEMTSWSCRNELARVVALQNRWEAFLYVEGGRTGFAVRNNALAA